jgi:hypothetical protein
MNKIQKYKYTPVSLVLLVISSLFANDSSNVYPSSVSFNGMWEIGLFTGYQRYGRNDSPVDAFYSGLYAPYHFSDSWFFQPVVTLALGQQLISNRSYFDLGGKFGIMSSSSPCHFYHASGFAYQKSWGYTTNIYSEQVSSGFSGFVMPLEWGVKIEMPRKVGLLTLAFHLAVGNDDNNTQWGYAFTAGYSFLK